jgi:hypothetical protein
MSEKRELIVQQLRDLGITRCVISYSGGGDSGQIEDVTCWTNVPGGEEIVDAEKLQKAAQTEEQFIVTQVTDRLLGEKTSPLNQRIENLAYELLEEAGVDDWVNNDGGAGTITVFVEDGSSKEDGDFEAGQILISQDTYETTSHNNTYTL